MKYRIRVEALDGEKLNPRYEKGIECEGFVLLADFGVGSTTGICRETTMRVAQMLTNDKVMLRAARIAVLLAEDADDTEQDDDEDDDDSEPVDLSAEARAAMEEALRNAFGGGGDDGRAE